MTITYDGRIYEAETEQALAVLFYTRLRLLTPVTTWAVAA